MSLTVQHMSGAGNSFVVIDDRSAATSLTTIQTLVPSLCNRVALTMKAAEGVIVLSDISAGVATSTFFNPDGSTDAMCGNGGRCLVRFALDNGAKLDARKQLMFTMAGIVYNAKVSNEGIICVDFPPPVEERDLLTEDVPELPARGTYVNVGSDHVVIDTRLLATNTTPLATTTTHLADLPLRDIALPIRHSLAFPRGTNVNLATVVNRDTIHMRTFERGVEGETGACGTGAISTAIALWRTGVVDDDVTLVPTSGRPLRVIIKHHNDAISRVTLCGDAVYDAESSQFDISTGQYL